MFGRSRMAINKGTYVYSYYPEQLHEHMQIVYVRTYIYTYAVPLRLQ